MASNVQYPSASVITNVVDSVGTVVNVVVKGVEVVDKLGEELLNDFKKREQERIRAERAKSTYVCPAYDEHELLDLFTKAKNEGLNYVVIRSDEIKEKTIKEMQECKHTRYRFDTPSRDEVETIRPDLFQTCCFVKSINLSEFVKISFSLI